MRMSNVIFLFSRLPLDKPKTSDKLSALCNELLPDNIEPNSIHHTVNVNNFSAWAISVDHSTFKRSSDSVLAGVIFESPDFDWTIPGADRPDGSYAIFRSNEEEVEFISDDSGSRTIWYYSDNDYIIGSTSQLAIIRYLGTFDFDENVIPWMLSSGTLGPTLSWDKRLNRLPAAASIRCRRNYWLPDVKYSEPNFSVIERRYEDNSKILEEELRKVTNFLVNLDWTKWALPLSGGYDSRAILCFLSEVIPDRDVLQAITWGAQDSINERGNDAYVAAELAKQLRVKHRFFETDSSCEEPEQILDRFVFCSEGRIDHISGYTDGMAIWNTLLDSGYTGIVRGDEGFGWVAVFNDQQARMSVGCSMCEDFLNLEHLSHTVGLPTQTLPDHLERASNESIAAWRDRLYHSYRISVVLGALSDIKLSYIEQINPLLSGRILNFIRSLSEELRTEKKLFKELIEKISPPVSFASKAAVMPAGNVLRQKRFLRYILSTLQSDFAYCHFGADLPREIVRMCFNREAMKAVKINSYREKKFVLSPEVLAFRKFLIIKTLQLFRN